MIHMERVKLYMMFDAFSTVYPTTCGRQCTYLSSYRHYSHFGIIGESWAFVDDTDLRSDCTECAV